MLNLYLTKPMIAIRAAVKPCYTWLAGCHGWHGYSLPGPLSLHSGSSRLSTFAILPILACSASLPHEVRIAAPARKSQLLVREVHFRNSSSKLEVCSTSLREVRFSQLQLKKRKLSGFSLWALLWRAELSRTQGLSDETQLQARCKSSRAGTCEPSEKKQKKQKHEVPRCCFLLFWTNQILPPIGLEPPPPFDPSLA